MNQIRIIFHLFLLCAVLALLCSPWPAAGEQKAPLATEEDNHLLSLLKPTTRVGHDGWMQLHLGYVEEIKANKTEV